MRFLRHFLRSSVYISAVFGCIGVSYAQHSSTLYGPLGLNTVPSARMDKAGMVRAGVSTLDPYVHGWLGVQLADPLAITIRQTAEVSNINDDADRLYPGVDFKLRLLEESAVRPEISIGVQSAIGHKRMAGEYLAASKRYKDFDFTAGLGWGRFGTAAHFENPFKVLGDHFDDRSLDGENPSRPNDWFTGEDIGIFGGVEYFTPLKGLSLKFDYGADRYAAESAAFDFDAPAPWSAGVNYQPVPWVDLALAAQGNDKIMGRLSLQSLIQKWPAQDRGAADKNNSTFRPFRTASTHPGEMETKAAAENIQLYGIENGERQSTGFLTLQNSVSTPRQLASAFTHMSNNAGSSIESLEITPVRLGLHGPRVKLMRADLENALAHNNGSAEEIWHNTEFIENPAHAFSKQKRPKRHGYGLHDVFINLDNQFSLSEEDSTTLYRTSIVAGTQAPELFGWLDSFLSFRLNLHDNLERLEDIRPRVILPVRSDIDRFARRNIGLETAFSAFTHSFRSDLHLSLMGGYLEEQYGGAGGELLYRPTNARWAIGAETFLAAKRNPETSLNTGFTGDRLLSGHVQGWYDIPFWDITANAKFGRYLAEDIGGSFALQKRFNNGAVLEGYVTLTDKSDFDLFGGTTHADHGLRLSLPLGGFKYIPQSSKINTKLAPFGRDIGQKLENPLPLYELTESFSTRHMAEYWSDMTQ